MSLRSIRKNGLFAPLNRVLTSSGWRQLVDADIASAAAIAYSKLSLAASIVNADISASAAIAYSKLNLAGSIVNADIASAAAIAYSKLNLAASIVNADIAAAANIAITKIAPLTAGTVLGSTSGSANSAIKVYDTPLASAAASSLVLTTTATNVPNCSVTLGVGRWALWSMADVSVTTADIGNVIFLLPTLASGSATFAGNQMIWVPTAAERDAKIMLYIVTVTATAVVNLQAYKNGATAGTTQVNAGTTFQAFYLSP